MTKFTYKGRTVEVKPRRPGGRRDYIYSIDGEIKAMCTSKDGAIWNAKRRIDEERPIT